MNEDKVKKAFKFPVKYGKDLGLEENDVKKLVKHATVGLALF